MVKIAWDKFMQFGYIGLGTSEVGPQYHNFKGKSNTVGHILGKGVKAQENSWDGDYVLTDKQKDIMSCIPESTISLDKATLDTQYQTGIPQRFKDKWLAIIGWGTMGLVNNVISLAIGNLYTQQISTLSPL